MADAADKPDDSWVQRYYERPSPERFEEEVANWQKAGVLRSASALPALAAFLSRLFRTAPAAQLDRWFGLVRGLPREDQKIFLIALWWADSPVAREAFETFIHRAGPGAAGMEGLLRLEPPSLVNLVDPTVEEIDMCWGAFFATGEAAYALPVIRRAATSARQDATDQTRQAARWSLKSLCATHPRLREIRDEFYQGATPEQARSLDDLFKS